MLTSVNSIPFNSFECQDRPAIVFSSSFTFVEFCESKDGQNGEGNEKHESNEQADEKRKGSENRQWDREASPKMKH